MASISEKFGNILEEAYNTLRDPSGRRRGAQAYYNVLESGQDEIAKKELQYERNTRFWLEHDAMLKRTDRSSTNWRLAKLDNELDILQENYKDSEWRFDRKAEEEKLTNFEKHPETAKKWKERLDEYEKLMKKGAAYQLTVDDLKTDKGREKNRARHIRPLQVKLEALAREVYNNYGLFKGDVKAILSHTGIGPKYNRSLVDTSYSDNNYDLLIPESVDPIEQKRIASFIKLLGNENITEEDLNRLRIVQEGTPVEPRLYERDPKDISGLTTHAGTAENNNTWYDVDGGAKDSHAPKVSIEDEVKLGGESYQIGQLLESLYNQRTNNDITKGGNAFSDIKTDHMQIAAIIANIGTDPEYGINLLQDWETINLTAWDLIKEGLSYQKGDYDSARYTSGYIDYRSFTSEEKHALIEQMPAILEDLGGNSTEINDSWNKIKREAQRALQVDSATLMKSFQEKLENSPPFKNQLEAENFKERISEMYPSLSPIEHDVMRNEVDNKFQKDTDPFFTPTQELGFDFYSRRLQEDINSGEFNNITQEVGPIPEEELKELSASYSSEEIEQAIQKASASFSEKVKKEGSFFTGIGTAVAADFNSELSYYLGETEQLTQVQKEIKNANIDKELVSKFSNKYKIVDTNNKPLLEGISSKQIQNVLENEVLPILAMVESSGGKELFNPVSTASGYFHFIEGTAKQAANELKDIDPNIVNEPEYKELIKSFDKGWKIGKNNMSNISLELQSRLAIAHILQKTVVVDGKKVPFLGNELYSAIITASTQKEKEEAVKKLYNIHWHTRPTDATDYNLSRKVSNFYSNFNRNRKVTGGIISLLDRDK